MNKTDRPTVSTKSEPRQACETCCFFVRIPMDASGRCHRYPKVVIGQNIAAFPLHYLLDWCGEWRIK